MHGATCVDFGVIKHVCGGKGLAPKVGNPITELFLTRSDEASLIPVKSVLDVKSLATSISIVRQVSRVDAVAQEEGIPPFL